MSEVSRCGFATIVGRPNVGKSTLLNYIIGQKVSITARKPQTTRNSILGIHSEGLNQTIYVDTPGLHTKEKKALNRTLNKSALNAMLDVDVVIFMIEAMRWYEDDQWILNKLADVKAPVMLLINKVDRIKEKARLMPFIAEVSQKYPFAQVIPLAALTGDNASSVNEAVAQYLPESVHLFPDDQVTDRPERFLAAEIIREKLIRNLGDEVPHSIAVSLEQYRVEGNIHHIGAVIWVEREGQKKIVIGTDGAVLKKIGTMARKELEALLGQKVFLQCWVKVKKSWSDDLRALRTLGLDESE